MITTVIFDVGGVLFYSSYNIFMKELAEKYSIDYSELKTWSNPYFNSAILGEISQIDVFTKICNKYKLDVSPLDLNDQLQSKSEPIKESWDLAKQLKPKFKLAVLSDMSEEAKLYKGKNYDFQIFSPIIWSCDVGVRKPSDDIFKIILSELEVPAEECVFIDDKPSNADAAMKNGMKALVFESPEKLRADLSNLGVKL